MHIATMYYKTYEVQQDLDIIVALVLVLLVLPQQDNGLVVHVPLLHAVVRCGPMRWVRWL